MKLLPALALLLALAPATLSAQELDHLDYGGGAVYLHLPTSPSLAASGSVSTRSTVDPHAFLYNPAHLGRFGREAALAAATYPGSTAWLPALTDLDLYSGAANVGLDLAPHGLPLYAGLGLAHTRLTSQAELRGPNNEPAGTTDHTESYTALALGAGLQYPVEVSLGLGLRRGSMDYFGIDPSAPDLEVVEATETFTAFDLGVLVNVPVHDLVGGIGTGAARFTLDWTLGYSQTGMGAPLTFDALDELSSFSAQDTPLDRKARLGHTVTLGLEVPVAAVPFRLATLGLSAEAEHSLVRWERDAFGSLRSYSYAAVLGEIDVLEHAFFGGHSSAVVGHRGAHLTLLEMIELSNGGFDGSGFDAPKTSGYTVRSGGALKLLGALLERAELVRFAERFDLAFSRAKHFDEHPFETTLTNVTFILRSF